ncbi:hypothetical protein CKO15_11285 [Halorhodospira abdelmalekii]|nr:hypothetical protein [Halorhodospira abdelmalekii]
MDSACGIKIPATRAIGVIRDPDAKIPIAKAARVIQAIMLFRHWRSVAQYKAMKTRTSAVAVFLVLVSESLIVKEPPRNQSW